MKDWADFHSRSNVFTAEETVTLESAKTQRDWPTLAQLLGVRVVQISETDSQVGDSDDSQTVSQKAPGEFVATWNIPSFCEECAAAAEFPWGTHEGPLPADWALD